MYNDGRGSGGVSSPALTNVILWGNSASNSGSQLYNNSANPTISYSLVQGGWNGSGIFNNNSSSSARIPR